MFRKSGALLISVDDVISGVVVLHWLTRVHVIAAAPVRYVAARTEATSIYRLTASAVGIRWPLVGSGGKAACCRPHAWRNRAG